MSWSSGGWPETQVHPYCPWLRWCGCPSEAGTLYHGAEHTLPGSGLREAAGVPGKGSRGRPTTVWCQRGEAAGGQWVVCLSCRMCCVLSALQSWCHHSCGTLRGNMEKGALENVVWLSHVDKLQSQHTQFGEGSGFWFSCVRVHVLFLSVDQGLLASTKLTFWTK